MVLSTMPPISTYRTATSDLKQLNANKPPHMAWGILVLAWKRYTNV